MATKKTTAKISADRAASLKKTDVRAGKSKANSLVRTKQNAGIKDGTIKVGANGKSYNIWDAASSSWKRGIVTGPKTPPKTFSGSSVPKTQKAISAVKNGAEGPKRSTKSRVTYGNR